MKALIERKTELIKNANKFLDLFDEENISNELYSLLQKEKIDKSTLIYLGQLVMCDENLLNDL